MDKLLYKGMQWICNHFSLVKLVIPIQLLIILLIIFANDKTKLALFDGFWSAIKINLKWCILIIFWFLSKHIYGSIQGRKPNTGPQRHLLIHHYHLHIVQTLLQGCCSPNRSRLSPQTRSIFKYGAHNKESSEDLIRNYTKRKRQRLNTHQDKGVSQKA